jgi:hypothetical protein
MAQGGGCDLSLLDTHIPEPHSFQIDRTIREPEQTTPRSLCSIEMTSQRMA